MGTFPPFQATSEACRPPFTEAMLSTHAGVEQLRVLPAHDFHLTFRTSQNSHECREVTLYLVNVMNEG